MRQVIYFAHFVLLLSDRELMNRVRRCKGRCDRAEVTGVLLCGRENIIHVVEGKPATIDALLANAMQEDATTGVSVVIDRQITKRTHHNWTFGTNRNMPPHPWLEGVFNERFLRSISHPTESVPRELSEIFLDNFRESLRMAPAQA